MKVIIIGAGAAGCFAAIEIKRLQPEAEVIVLEKARRPLAKVAITGGGRCNVTNSFADVRSLEQVYPRGHRLMKKLLHHFSHLDTMQWFEHEGVRLVIQEDNCVFPKSQDAMEIVNKLSYLMRQKGVMIMTEMHVHNILSQESGFTVETMHRQSGEVQHFNADKVLVTIGGQPQQNGFSLFDGLDLEIIPPLPSLFSFNINDNNLKELMGTVVKEAQVSIPGTKLKASGALLITHWGISGPAVLRLSSVGARVLAEKKYQTDINISWLGAMRHDDVLDLLMEFASLHPAKQLSSVYPEVLNSRLWNHLLQRAKLSTGLRWKELSSKDLNRLVNTLANDSYSMTGKNRFKDEFVTCGGVALSNLNPSTLEAKAYPGLFFAGEATDVDAITGGFNLQAAWTMAYTAAHGMVTG